MIVDTHIEELKSLFIKHGVVLAYLIGKHADGRARPTGDIEIGAIFSDSLIENRRLEAQEKIAVECARLFAPNRVQVVDLMDASPRTMYLAVKHKRILYEDPTTQTALDFTVYAASRHADWQAWRKAFRKTLRL